jgi:uncharacterized hydrophobic protein (TIGR00271 family)
VRRLLVRLPRGCGLDALRIARDHNGTNISVLEALGEDEEPIDLVLIHVSNGGVGPLLEALDRLPNRGLSLVPDGVLTLRPPASEVPEQVRDVSERSPFEVYVSGLQSVGSWKGFLGYAVAAGIVVWLGLFTNTSYLLVAAMLIAPFAGPAMNAAIASARGDLMLLGRSVGRYLAALSVAIVTAGALSALFRQEVATEQMAATANISSAAIILPLAAGAAGALHLVQAQNSSLVSGAAVGMLVAASLSPPAGLVGMGVVIGEWEMVSSGLFLLGLQLVGINLSGMLVFRLFGLRAEGPRYARGRSWVVWVSLIITVLGLGAFALWQFGSTSPEYQRATVEQRVRGIVRESLDDYPEASLVEVSARFTRPEITGQQTLLVTIYAQRSVEGTLVDDELQARIRERVVQAILRGGFNVTPLVDVKVLSPP